MPKMSRTKTLKGHCTHCDGLLEFPAEATGTTVDCPLCGQPTELLLARPVEEPTIPRATIVWTLIAVLILGGGLAGALAALKRAERLVKRGKKPAATAASVPGKTNAPTTEDIAAKSGFRISPIRLEKVDGSSLVYASGILTNATDKQRFGIKVELDLLDAGGQKIGTASDYQGVIETNGQWQFKALVVDPRATAAARLADIKEQK
jgi:hypothetical protein